MNIYMIVEGEQTEMKVYPAWIQILAPQLHQISDAYDIKSDSDAYYLFSAGGIPSIYTHISNAVADINEINAKGNAKYDYLIVCIDVEEESRSYIEHKIKEQLLKDGRDLSGVKLQIFEHKICMESWFLGNRKIFKENPQNPELSRYIRFYDVKSDDPELMENIDSEEFSTKAQFHFKYLKYMFQERNMRYSKNKPGDVCLQGYLEKLIERYENTNHIGSFGRWCDFIRAL